MMSETAAAVLSRATATDRAMQGAPRASEAVIVAEMDITMTDTENQYLTLQDVADRLKLKLRTVRDHEARGILPASRLSRRVRVSEDQYREYVRRLEALGTGGAVEDLARPDARGLIIETVREYLRTPEGRALVREAFEEGPGSG